METRALHYLVCGPSGSGKSTFAAALAEEHGALFLEADLYPADGLDLHGLARAWQRFQEEHDPTPLAAELTARAAADGAPFTVLALSGRHQLGAAHAELGRGLLKTVFIYANVHQCLESFLARERRLGRHLGEKHWRAQGAVEFCRTLRTKPLQPYVLRAFDPKGHRREVREMIREVG
jgi:hypothetical protein